MRTIEADVAIVGGGIIGASTALFLQRAGKRAVVLEREIVAAQASGRNGGGLRTHGRAGPELAFACAAAALWPRLDELLGRPTGYRRIGNLFVAENDAELEALAAQRAHEQGSGVATELLDARQVRALAPGIAPHVVGGKLCPADGHAVPAQATVAIVEAACELGARFFPHTPVTRVLAQGGEVRGVESAELSVAAPVVLDAAGPWAPYVAQLVDVYLPIFPSRSHQLITPPLGRVTDPFTIAARWDFSTSQAADGRVQLSGGGNAADLGRFTFSKRVVPQWVAQLRQRAAELFPVLAGAPIEGAWVGTREHTPDMLPIMGPVEEPRGFFVCAGFSGHGFCLGPYAGQLMAEWIVDGAPSLDLRPFHYQRFQRPEGPLAAADPALQLIG